MVIRVHKFKALQPQASLNSLLLLRYLSIWGDVFTYTMLSLPIHDHEHKHTQVGHAKNMLY